MKPLLTLFILALSFIARAQEPVYQITFDDTENMKFLGEHEITIFPVSGRVKNLLDSDLEKNVIAADHKSGIIISTKHPDRAVQEVLNQVSVKTGVKISHISSSVLKKASPTAIAMGASKFSTWYIVLSPGEEGDHVLTISYLIEAEKEAKKPIGLLPYSDVD